LKLAEIIQLYALKFQQSDYWLDFGSAPGGASMYLLDKGCKVWGIDPAKVSQSITENKNYTHILTPVQDLSQESLPDDIHWVHADLNLKPTQAIKEVLRLIKKYHHSLKGVIFTVQLPNLDYIENLEDFEDQFYDWGFSDILSTQVPSHKQEYTIIARR
jgi:23S rRNA C2498 (ribose-2'-O)-methylase RlmM